MILKVTFVLLGLVCFVFTRNVVIPGRGRNTYNSSSYSTNETRQNTIKIIGGVETDKYEFPFIVSLSRQGRHFCGGSIIDREWVLTAAHCASESDFAVTAGEHNLNVDEGTEQTSRAMVVIRHPDYNPLTYENDICLVKVSPPFAYDDYVKPFAVPSTHYIANGDATVAGWGTEDEVYQEVSPVLRKVTIPLVQSIDCARQYGGYFLPLKMICAGEEEGGKDACQGDSGGPLMCSDSTKGATLCGVVSFGLGCARPELAGVYTKVAHYSDWIKFEMNKYVSGSRGKTTPRYPNTIRRTSPPTKPTAPNKQFTIPPGSTIVIIKPGDNATRQDQHYHDHDHKYPPRRRNSSNIYRSNNNLTVLGILIGFFLCWIE